MKNINIVLVLLAALFVAGCAGPEVRFAKISREVSAAGREHNMDALHRLSSSIKTEDLSPERMGGYSDNAINSMYDALLTISLYLPDEETYALRLESAFNEKVRRRKYTGDEVERIFNVFTMSGLFNKAVSVRQRFPEKSLPEVPEIATTDVSTAGWWIYEVSTDGKKAALRSLPKSGQRMIMVMRPGCSFAEMAADTIFTDPELGPVFRANGFMLSRKFEPVDVESIKKRFNFNAVYIARKSGDFPGISLLRISPTFYFVKDGQILDKFSGWSDEDGGEYAKDKIRKGLAAIGIKTKTGARSD